MNFFIRTIVFMLFTLLSSSQFIYANNKETNQINSFTISTYDESKHDLSSPLHSPETNFKNQNDVLNKELTRLVPNRNDSENSLTIQFGFYGINHLTPLTVNTHPNWTIPTAP